MRFIDKEKKPFAPTRVLLVILLCQALLVSFIPFIAPNTQTEGSRAESGYHTYEEMVSEIQQIEVNHSSIVRLHNLTTTFEDKTIWALKVSDSPEIEINDPSEPDVLFTAGQKANSLISVEIALYLLNHLTLNYGKDNRVTELVNNREIWIIPMLNPDGHEYVNNEDEDWLKNRRKNEDDTFGVNLNTNYGFEWGLDDHSSDDTSSLYYHGKSNFSEAETNGVKTLVESQNFVLSLSFSSYGENITYPWGYTNTSTSDDDLLHEIASDMAMYSGYDVLQSGEQYINHGNMDDWLYGNRSILSFTVRAGVDNIPEESEIEEIAQKNLPGCLYLIDIADDPNRALKSEWTFMVYMGADDNLEDDGELDINEMEKVGSDPYINIVVQFDRGSSSVTGRYLVMKDDDDQVINSPMIEDRGEVNMGDPQVLLEFVNWSITNYPAERYFLDFWGHGKGWMGVTSDNGDWLEMNEIKSVLPKFKERMDVVGFDNCNMAMIEVYTQFLGHTDYIVGSEKEEDAWGWPYDRIFNDLETNPQTSPLNLSTSIVKHYVDWAKEENIAYSATASAVDMTHLYGVINKTDTLAKELNWTMALYANEIMNAIDDTEDYSKKPTPHDLYNFFELVRKYVPNRPIQIAAENIMSSIENLVVAEEHWSSPGDPGNPVDNAHGIAVWLYDGSISELLKYQGLDFAILTHWDEFLATYKNPLPKPAVNFTMSSSLSDSDGDGNDDTIILTYTTNITGFNITTKVCNNENQHVTTFYTNGTLQNQEYNLFFNPKDYGYPSDYYNFYSYLVNDANDLQNYSEVVGIWLGNEKPDGLLENLTFYRKDGTLVGGNTGKNPIDGENTQINVHVRNNGSINLIGLKIEIFDGENLIKTDFIGLEIGEEKIVSAQWLARAGERDIRIILDGENLIKETNESNNQIEEEIEVKPNIPVSLLTIKGKIYNKDNINIIGAKVRIKNLRTNETINKTTNEKGYETKLDPDWYLEGDIIEVRAKYSDASENATIFAYSDDKTVFVNLTLDTEVYDVLFYFKIGLIIFEIIGFILVIKYYIGMKRKKGKE